MKEEVRAALAQADIAESSVAATAQFDLLPDKTYGTGWVVATDAELVVAAETDSDGGLLRYPYESVNGLKAENLVTGGMLTAKVDDEERVLCRFSNSRLREMSALVRIAETLRKGEEPSAEDTAAEPERLVCPTCGLRYPDPDRKVCPKCLDKGSIFVRLLSYFKPHLGAAALILVCMGVQAALEMFAPFLNGKIFYDEVLAPGGRYYGRIGGVLSVMIGIRLLAILVSVVYGRLVAKVSSSVVYSLKTDIFTAMQRLSLGFFTKKSTGALMNRVNWDAMRLEFFFIDAVPFFVVNLFILIGISITMFSLNWLLALMVFVPAPLILFVTKKFIPRVWSMYGRRYRRRSILNSVVNDSLTGVRVVKSFGREEAEISRFGGANIGLYGANMSAQQLSATVFPFIHLILQTGGFIVWLLGGWQVVQGRLTFGVLMTFVGYIAMFYRPMQFFTRIIDWWAMCMNSAQRIFEIMDTTPDVSEAADPVRVPQPEGRISVRDVTFAYEPNKPVLHDINIDIEAGEMIGLVGHTGAGKSTITNLITRLYDVEQGSVTIDGYDVKDIAVDDLRTNIGIVLQQTYLFSGTVAENIAYADPDAAETEIIRAAKAANAHDFIVTLPDGYETRLGRQGHDLSGGERQRIAIARAILKAPRILVFDEATSSVDTETEERIQEAIGRLVKGRTTIAIAHRLSTLRRADSLYVIEKGRIIESGGHEELMRKGGKYHELVTREQKALKVIAVAE